MFDLLKLLSDKRNRRVWQSMICLSLIAEGKAREIFENRDTIIDAVEKGSVITQDNGIKTLAKIASVNNEYYQAIFPYLIEKLKACRPKSVAQYADGSFPNSYSIRKDPENVRRNDESCYYALTLWGLIRLGYQDDERVKKALSFVLSESRWDGGYLYMKSYVKDSTKSCARGSKNVLRLFAELPDLWETDECQKLVEYFLDRKVFFKRNDYTQFARGYPFTVYPFHYRFGILEPVYALSKMGYRKHASLSEAWEFLEEKKDETGKFMLDWSMPRCAFNPGKKGIANKWVTLYAYLSKKQLEN